MEGMNIDRIGDELANAYLDGLKDGAEYSASRRKKAINEELEQIRDEGISVEDISDGYHTFEELYFHRMILFSIILNQNAYISWKAKKHHDGTMFGDDSFICGIETPEGQYTYHYHLDYWDYFNVKELEFAPEYDGHKPKDVIRLLSILRQDKLGAIEDESI